MEGEQEKKGIDGIAIDRRIVPDNAKLGVVAWLDYNDNIHTRLVTAGMTIAALDDFIYLYSGIRMNFREQIDDILKAVRTLVDDERIQKIADDITTYLGEIDAGKIEPPIVRHNKFAPSLTQEEEGE